MNDEHARFRFRQAEARDRDAVFAFCLMTWDDGDYIPRVWDAWLADPLGALVVGVDAADAPVALGKLSVPAAGDGYIQGIRVAPSVRRQGWGRALFAHLRDRAHAQGLPHVRFLTAADNTAVHRLAAPLAFRRVGDYLPVRREHAAAPPRLSAAPDSRLTPRRGGAGHASHARIQPATAADAPRLWAALTSASAARPPVRWLGWEAATATPTWLAEQAVRGHVLQTPNGAGMVVMRPADAEAVLLEPPVRQGQAEIALLLGPPALHGELLDAAQAWAAAHGATRTFGLLPPAYEPVADALGWIAYTQLPMTLYEHQSALE